MVNKIPEGFKTPQQPPIIQSQIPDKITKKPLISSKGKELKFSDPTHSKPITKNVEHLTVESKAKTLESLTLELKNEIEALKKEFDLPVQDKKKLSNVEVANKEIKDQFSKILKQLENFSKDFLSDQSEKIDTFQKINDLYQTTSKIIDLVYDFKALLAKKTDLTDLKNKFKNLDNLQDKSPDEIEKIKANYLLRIKEMIVEIENKQKELILSTGLMIPKASYESLSGLKTFFGITCNKWLSYGLGLAQGVRGVIKSGFEVYKTSKTKSLHEFFIEDLQPKQLSEKIEIKENSETKPLKKFNIHLDHPSSLNTSSEEFLKDSELTENQKIISQMLNQRAQIFQKRMQDEEINFDRIVSEYKDDENKLIETLISQRYQIEASFSIKKLTPEGKLELIKHKVDLQDTLTALAKNGFKEKIIAHEKLNQEFLSQKVIFSSAAYIVATLVTASLGVLFALSTAGFSIPATIFLAPTIFSYVSSAALLGFGFIYLYKTKPNLAKTYLNFDPIKLIFKQLQLLWANLIRNYAENNLKELAQDIQAIANTAFNTEEEENNARLECIKKQEEAFEYLNQAKDEEELYQKEIKEIKDRIKQARIDDYELLTSYKKTGYKSFSEIAKGKEEEISELNRKSQNPNEKFLLPPKTEYEKKVRKQLENNPLNDFEMIAESLIDGSFWMDPEASRLLKKYADVAIDKNQKLNQENKVKDRTFLADKIHHIVIRNSQEIISWINKEEIKTRKV